MRYFSAVSAVATVLLGFSSAFAGSINLTLLGANPTGTVYVTSTALPAGYQSNTDVYAGVLDWTDKGGSTPDYFTYCVDIASIITVNSGYGFTTLPFNATTGSSLASDLSSTFTTPVVDGIENLWTQNAAAFAATLGGTINSTTDAEAEELQIALWDIIYNGPTGTLYDGSKSASPLYFNNASPNDLATALGLATTAYDAAAPTSIPSNLCALQATGNGQNQIFLGSSMTTVGTSVVPLPMSFYSFVVMLGIVGLFRKTTRTAKTPVIA